MKAQQEFMNEQLQKEKQLKVFLEQNRLEQTSEDSKIEKLLHKSLIPKFDSFGVRKTVNYFLKVQEIILLGQSQTHIKNQLKEWKFNNSHRTFVEARPEYKSKKPHINKSINRYNEIMIFFYESSLFSYQASQLIQIYLDNVEAVDPIHG
eukprot:gene11913-5318_t